MVNCAVKGCKNYSVRKHSSLGIRYYSFPKDPNLRTKWVECCGRGERFNVDHARICSDHFGDQDWALKDVLLKLPKNKRKLKDTAIPSINVPVQSKDDGEDESSSQQQLVRDALEAYDRGTLSRNQEQSRALKPGTKRKSDTACLKKACTNNSDGTKSQAQRCRLCLDFFSGSAINGSIVSKELNEKLVAVFPFPLDLHEHCTTSIICNTCIERVEDFYLYQERVRVNQNSHAVQDLPPVDDFVEKDRVPSCIEFVDVTKEDMALTDPGKEDLVVNESTLQQIRESPKRKEGRMPLNEFYSMACEICGKQLENWRELKVHFRTQHDLDGWVSCCNRRIGLRTDLIEHMAIHMGITPFDCQLCHRRFRYANSLKVHLQKVHVSHRPFRCTRCPKTFSTGVLLKQHEAHHVRVRCPQCEKSLANASSLRCHLIHRHSGGKSFVCDMCGKMFGTRHTLNQHQAYHHGRKEQCGTCGRWYSPKSIQLHRLAHERVGQRYQCTMCGHSFLTSTTMKAHMMQEHAVSRYECELCGKRYKYSIGLRQHVATHSGVRLYHCGQCEFSTNNKGHFYMHRKRKHAIATTSVESEQDSQTNFVPTFVNQVVEVPVDMIEIQVETDETIEHDSAGAQRLEESDGSGKAVQYKQIEVTFGYVDENGVFLQSDDIHFSTLQ